MDDTCETWVHTSTPIPVLGPRGGAAVDDWTAIAAGEEHTLALRSTGEVYAWGEDDEGNLGYGVYDDVTVPTPVCAHWDTAAGVCAVPLSNVVAIAAGDEVGFAIRDDGTLWGWGDNDDGQLGFGRPEVSVPERVIWPTGAEAE